MSLTPPARNAKGFLRQECRIIGGPGLRKRSHGKRTTASFRVKAKLKRRLPGRTRAWEDAQTSMTPPQVPANAWNLWGKPCQIKQRLTHRGMLPTRHAKVPINWLVADGIGRKHASARFTRYLCACAELKARCDATIARLGKGD